VSILDAGERQELLRLLKKLGLWAASRADVE
jgi:hypothetical protein